MLSAMVIDKHCLSNANALSPSISPVYSKAVGGPVLRSNAQQSTSTSESTKSSAQRYKTELCRSYQETGLCKYGDKCQFAHGYDELRSLNRHPKYKTILCRTYHCTGYCPYGPRCHFLHDECSETSSYHTISPSSSFASDLRSSVSSSRSISPIITGTDDLFLSSFLLNKIHL